MLPAITVIEQLRIDLPQKRKAIEHVGILGKSEPFPRALFQFPRRSFSVAKRARHREQANGANESDG